MEISHSELDQDCVQRTAALAGLRKPSGSNWSCAPVWSRGWAEEIPHSDPRQNFVHKCAALAKLMKSSGPNWSYAPVKSVMWGWRNSSILSLTEVACKSAQLQWSSESPLDPTRAVLQSGSRERGENLLV